MSNPTPPVDNNYNFPWTYMSPGTNTPATVLSAAGGTIIRQGDGGLWDSTNNVYVQVEKTNRTYPNV